MMGTIYNESTNADNSPFVKKLAQRSTNTITQFLKSPMRRPTNRRHSIEEKIRREDEIARFFLSQVSELLTRRNSTVVMDLIERLKSFKMA